VLVVSLSGVGCFLSSLVAPLFICPDLAVSIRYLCPVAKVQVFARVLYEVRRK